MSSKPEEQKIIKQTIALYHHYGWKKYFARLRFWYAPFVEIEKLLPKKGTIVDLGCAEGILTSYAALSSKDRQMIGIDIDAKRIKQSPHLKNAIFKHGDVTKTSFPKSDALVVFHVLHHMESLKTQEDFIQKCHEQLKPSGLLIIIEVNVRPTLKYLMTWFTDRILVAWVFEKNIYAKIFFRKKSDWEKLLSQAGFNVKTITPPDRGPFSNIIFVCSPK